MIQKKSRQDFELEELIRPNIRTLIPYRCARDTVQSGLLLDANENPFEHQACRRSINRYPDPHQRKLRKSLADRLGVKPDQVLAGNGSDEVLDWILKVFCTPGQDRLALTPPTYGMYQVIADILGVDVYRYPLNRDFSFDADRFLQEVPSDVKLLILCSPNNPTANLLDQGSILSVVSRWDGIVVVDEAYIEFARQQSLVRKIDEYQNLLVLRTFSKALGRAGLRLGYVVASAPLIEIFRRVKMPYNLSSLAQAEGIQALCEFDDSEKSIKRIIQQRDRMMELLRGFRQVDQVFPSEANFILFECQHASEVYQRLLSQGIIIRDRSSVPGLKNCLRVSVGSQEDNETFLNALEAHLQEFGS